MVRMAGYLDPRAPLLICPLSEVLRSQLRVDLTVLCDLVERLSGLFIMARNVLGGVLHNVIMPRSWFITLILPDTDLRKDTSTLSTFAETMIDLMQQIDTQVQRPPTSAPEEQFTVDGRQMVSFMGPFYIARM